MAGRGGGLIRKALAVGIGYFGLGARIIEQGPAQASEAPRDPIGDDFLLLLVGVGKLPSATVDAFLDQVGHQVVEREESITEARGKIVAVFLHQVIAPLPKRFGRKGQQLVG